MKKISIISFFCLLAVSCFCQKKAVPVIKFKQIENILDSKAQKIVIVNFWATWCAPCVKELPLFDSLHAKKNPDIKIYLISLDFADHVERVENFVERKKIKPEVLLLDEIDYDSWISKVERSWEGPIPATLIFNTQTGQRKFIAKELNEGELEKLVQELSNP